MLGVYFSGTGNTKYAMNYLVKKIDINGEIASIEDENVREKILKSDRIFFGYPIQFSNLPYIVRDFINKNKDLWKGKEMFIICTMGLFSGDGALRSVTLFKKYGATILGGLHLVMPDSVLDKKALKYSNEENKIIVDNAKEKMNKTIELIKKKKYPQNGLSFWNHLGGLFGQRLYFYHEGMGYSKKTKIDLDKCVRCGKCVRECPMHNLILENNKIVSLKRCTKCYRCVSNCPKEAITILGTKVVESSHKDIENYLRKELEND